MKMNNIHFNKFSRQFLYLATITLAVSGMFCSQIEESMAKDPNSFNRLMQAPSKRNPPPAEDGIHAPDNDGTFVLQPPKEQFSQLPKGQSGNYVDWVKALDEKKIKPRYDRVDPALEPVLMDLNIVREVKGSMPDVVYPHKQHTEWLDCSNCHPAIFIPQKGANQISMAAIILGESCGVCHGKIAFPVSECRRCHSKPKNGQEKAIAGGNEADKGKSIAAQGPGAP